ncbi:MAG: hypothetical protein FJ100_02815 [Deltaproteobacteria bacterium]|nr:hypothetical protein [Deltaproteobacteria bacterium]
MAWRHSLTGLGLVASACGPLQGPAVVANPVRHSLDQQVALARKQPLQLRFNPALCNCPPFEVRVGERWWRAELSSPDAEALAAWIDYLAAAAGDVLPVAVAVEGALERDILRTSTGAYALRVDVVRIVEPLPPPPPPVVPPPEPASRT